MQSQVPARKIQSTATAGKSGVVTSRRHYHHRSTKSSYVMPQQSLSVSERRRQLQQFRIRQRLLILGAIALVVVTCVISLMP